MRRTPRERRADGADRTVLVVLVSGARGSEFVFAAGVSARSTGQHHRICPSRRWGWTPTCLLREFLKATADPPTGIWRPGSSSPSRRHAHGTAPGSALLLDRVVFVETRGSDRVSVNMRADILGVAVRYGSVRDGEGRTPTRSHRARPDARAAGASTSCPTGFPRLAAVSSQTYKRSALLLRRPDR